MNKKTIIIHGPLAPEVKACLLTNFENEYTDGYQINQGYDKYPVFVGEVNQKLFPDHLHIGVRKLILG